jgi:hypothetical protein
VLFGGRLLGPGYIAADLYNAADVDVNGGLTVECNYTQTSAGSLEVEMDGAPNELPPPLTIGGTAFLAGTLNVTFPDGFVAAHGGQYIVLTAGAISGQFDVVNISSVTGAMLTPGYPDGVVTLIGAPDQGGGGQWDGNFTLPAALLVSQGPLTTDPEPRVDDHLVVPQSFDLLGNTGFAGHSPLAPPGSSFVPGGAAAGPAPPEATAAVASAGEEGPLLALDDDDASPSAILDIEPPAEETTVMSHLASSLLTGGQPRVQVLPQQGSPVASVATLLTAEGDASTQTAAPTAEEEAAELKALLIGPVGTAMPAATPKTEDSASLRPMLVLGGLFALAARHRGRSRRPVGDL